MSLFSRIAAAASTAWSLLSGLVWVAVLHPIWRLRSHTQPRHWVVGGHRGRLYGDNAAGVEGEARRQGKRVFWIANRNAAASIRRQGANVLIRGSWAARRAISQAQALIYSHGEDDLDLVMLLLRGRTATRIYLGHCLSLLKAGGVADPVLERASAPLRWLKTWLLTRWDFVLCASHEELANLARTYPMNRGFRLGGGAHLDAWQKDADKAPLRRIYWFPTFRDTAKDADRLQAVIREVTQSKILHEWLREHDYEFLLGTHINSQENRPDLVPPMRTASLTQLVDDIRSSELLISDYSGVLFDFLLLERPQILFAFDLDDYLRHRHLYLDYTTLKFGLHPKTAAELVEVIVSGAWRSEVLQRAAKERRAQSLPPPAESFAAQSVRAIEELVNPVAMVRPSAAASNLHDAPSV
jgi:hypothetical protein